MSEPNVPDEIHQSGISFDCIAFVADAAVRFAAAAEANSDQDTRFESHDERSRWAFECAEDLWREFAERFPPDEEEVAR